MNFQVRSDEDADAHAISDPGEYRHRVNQDDSQEVHMNDPMAIAELQTAARENSVEAYKRFSAANTALSRRVHLRGLLRFKTAGALFHPIYLLQTRKLKARPKPWNTTEA